MDIVELIKQGKSAKEVSDISGKSVARVYQIAKSYGLKFADKKPWCDRDKKIIEYRQLGFGYKKISKLIGVDRGNLVAICKRLGVQGKDIYSNTSQQQQEAQVQSVQALCESYGFKYLSGYRNSKSVIKVSCMQCGAVKALTYSGMYSGRAVCLNCKGIALQQEKERQQKLKQAQQEKMKRTKRFERFADGNPEQIAMNTCIECGALMLQRGKYCSAKCAEHAHNRTKSHVRRIRIATRRHDTDITLRTVYKNDNGICYLCGGRCDWNDYVMVGETFIAGNSYPSIDHVFAIASGGTHEWDNVRLAHRWCNSVKSNT